MLAVCCGNQSSVKSRPTNNRTALVCRFPRRKCMPWTNVSMRSAYGRYRQSARMSTAPSDFLLVTVQTVAASGSLLANWIALVPP